MSLNKVMLIGNLSQKPELRQTNSNLAVTRLSVATTERRKGGDGNWANHTEWHNVTVFGKQAENCVQFLDKGRQVYVEGRLSTRKWQDKDGNDRKTTEVIASDVRFLSNKGDSTGSSSGYNSGGYNSNSGGGSGYGSNSNSGGGSGFGDSSGGEDGIPF